jgi:hypothetical protein
MDDRWLLICSPKRYGTRLDSVKALAMPVLLKLPDL